jgi:hypothetical protein
MENIVRIDTDKMLELATRLERAAVDGRTARLLTGRDKHGSWLKWDTGSGWTEPFYGLDY